MYTYRFFRKSDTVWYFLLFALLLLTLYIQYLSKHGYIPLTGIYVPDGYTYELRALENRELEEFSAFSYNLFNQFIYNSFLGAFGFFLFNSSLLFLSVWLCRPVFAGISESSINYARFAIVFNPYLLIGAIGPNKESILLFINLLFWYLCFPRYRDRKRRSNNGKWVAKIIKLVLVVTVAFINVFVRPITSVILYVSFIYKIVGYKKYRLVALWLLIFYFLSISIPAINEIYAEQVDQGLSSFASSTIYDLSATLAKYSLDPIMQYPAFIAKTILLFFGFIVRPFSFSELLDVGYSFLAVAYFPINLSLILTFFNKNNYNNPENSSESGEEILSSPNNDSLNTFLIFALLSMFMVVVSPGFTFRYFIPVTPFSFALFICQNPSTRKVLVTISVLIGVLVIVGNLIFYQKSYYQDVSLPVFMDWL
ncbi:hypothetical protein [Cylindrospermopsis raciborskii]|uniref:hypothetical protein n=1 Tax=Cylindrospermopsis raciborskii TaxID=77022 RepID=UPI001141F9A4|nr:hypothetical protein [Cylindrospermopsis raciborskii]